MRGSLIALTVVVVGLARAPVARADGGVVAPSVASATWSYEVENADALPGKVLVVWPRACSSTGEPLGAVDLKLNPDWAARMNDVDYEVVVSGKRHELSEDCRKTSRLYALPADAFPKGSRVSTADDKGIGQGATGQPFAVLPQLDTIDRKKRIEFFEKDPRVLRTSFRFDAAPASKSAKPLAGVHQALTVTPSSAAELDVTVKRVVYTYQDGTSDTANPSANAGGDASTGAGIAINPAADGAAGGVPDLANRPDGGTRWVFLAAVAGLVVGGLIAFFRKKRASS
jgi:hypothetical protein